MSQLSSEDYVKNLLQAIDIIAEQKDKQNQYNKTLLGTVVEQTDAATGKYKIKYQDGYWYAYSYNPHMKYVKGNTVYVLVPNGDMSNTKLILGPSNTEHPIDYSWQESLSQETPVITSEGQIPFKDYVESYGGGGKGAKIVSITYTSSDTQQQPPDSQFIYDTVPIVGQGQWLWSCILFKDESRVYLKAKQGQKGEKGQQGQQGPPGEKGERGDAGQDGAQGEAGEDALRVEIESSAGNIFKRSSIQTVLLCHVYKGTKDVTDQVLTFTWKKYNANGVLDPNWSRPYARNAISVSSSDVLSRAIFKCEVTI